MLKRDYRLRDRKSVAKVYRSGKTARAGILTMRYTPNHTDASRLAVVVSKKVAKSAPVRNRIRRRLSEAMRRRWDKLKPGYDLIISVHSDSAATVSPGEIDQLADQLINKADLHTQPPKD